MGKLVITSCVILLLCLCDSVNRNWVFQILCRRPHLDEKTYNQLVERAKEEGYDVSKLHKTPQAETPPEEDGPKDTKGIWWIKSILGW